MYGNLFEPGHMYQNELCVGKFSQCKANFFHIAPYPSTFLLYEPAQAFTDPSKSLQLKTATNHKCSTQPSEKR